MSNDDLRHDPAQGIYFVDFEDGGIGQVVYRRNGDVLDLVHSEVPANRRGQGLGARLMTRVMTEMDAKGQSVRPVCGYTVAYLRRHSEWAHLVA